MITPPNAELDAEIMFWIDAKYETVKPPTYRPLLCYCPGWNVSGYQVANYISSRFVYSEDMDGDFHGCVKRWLVFLEPTNG